MSLGSPGAASTRWFRLMVSLRLLGRRQAVALSLVLLWTLAGAALYVTWRGLESASLQRAELFARVLADQTARSLLTVELTARTATERARLRQEADDRVQLLGELASGQGALRSLNIVDEKGQVLASSSHLDRDVDPRVPLELLSAWTATADDRRWWLADGSDLSDARALQPDVAASRLMAVRAWPVVSADGGRVDQWLVAVLNLEHFATQQSVLLDDERWQAALVDVQGILLASTPNLDLAPGASIGPHPAIDGLLARSAQATEQLSRSGNGLDGRASHTAHRVLARQPMALVVETHRAHMVKSWLDSAALVMGASVLGSLLLLAYSHALSRQDRARLRAKGEATIAARRASRSEEELRSLVDGLPEWTFRSDAHGRIQFVNRCWHRLSGLPDDRVLGRRLEDVLHPADAAAIKPLFEMSEEADPAHTESVRVRLLNVAGEWLELDLTVAPLSADGSGGFAGFAIDVTERERARRQLVEQYRMTEQLLDAMPQPLFLTDANGDLQMANRAWVEWLGLADGAPDGTGSGDDLALVHTVIGKGTDEVAAHGPRSWPVDLPRADGGLRETLLSKVPLHREDGHVVGVIGTMVDVTEFRQAERFTERARRAAEAASAARAEFVANVSHELRTPLQSILGFAELGRERAPDAQRAALLFHRIETSGKRMLKLVEDLLDVSAMGNPVGRIELLPAPPASVLDDVCEELRSLAASGGIELKVRIPGELKERPAKIDGARYAQVVRNVLANAIRFAPAGSPVEVALVDCDGQAIVSVRDHGPGIPEDELEAIFDPFVQSTRTRDGSGGTGLGLAICRSIMRAHGGFVIADNDPRGGAVFRIGLAWSNAATLPERPVGTEEVADGQAAAAQSLQRTSLGA